MIRRPPIFIGGTPAVPPIPWVKPLTTPDSGNDAGWPPRDQDESNAVPFLYSTPVYCTDTVDAGVAALPVPTTRSLNSSLVGSLVALDVTPGAPLRSAAPLTVTPLNVTLGPLAAGADEAGADVGALAAGDDGAVLLAAGFFLSLPPAA